MLTWDGIGPGSRLSLQGPRVLLSSALESRGGSDELCRASNLLPALWSRGSGVPASFGKVSPGISGWTSEQKSRSAKWDVSVRARTGRSQVNLVENSPRYPWWNL